MSAPPRAEPPGPGLAAALAGPGLLLAAWLGMVIVFTWRRQPGIICLTPVLWLASAAIGRGLARAASPAQAETVRRQALIAGLVFGAAAGLLYTLDIALTAGPGSDILWFAAWSGSLCLAGGAVACGLLALAVAALSLRRRGA